MKKHAFRITAGILLLLIFLLHSSGLLSLPFVSKLDLWSYDHRLVASMPGTLDERIVIVDIDEKSLAEVGRWPWSRNRVAMLVDQLFDRYGVAVVAFDIVFAEPDTSSGLPELEALAKGELKGNPDFRSVLPDLRQKLSYDQILADSFAGRPVVLGYYFTADSGENTQVSGVLPPPVLKRDAFNSGVASIAEKRGYGANIAALQQPLVVAGHFNPDPDEDGVTRRVPMLQRHGGEYYESLSLAVLRVMFGHPPLLPGFPASAAALEWLQVADIRIPVDSSASALIPYRGYQGSFLYVSAVDVLEGRVDRKILEGGIALVGTTAPGLMDLRSTPVSAVYAGVEVHANMIAGMLDGKIRHAPQFARGADLALLTLGGGVLALLLPFLGPLASLALAACVMGVTGGINYMAWRADLVLPLASQLLLFPALFAFNAGYGFLVESLAKRQITGLFGQYVPPQIVNRMSRDPGRFTMAAESREMTVLFTDVVGFTTLSEQLSPKDLATFLNEYLTAMTAIIYRHGGTVDKYIGDAIMAFWGAPLEDHEHARHAVNAALEMQQRMVTLRSEMQAKGLPAITIGIGINSGQMRIGNMGSAFRVAYTAMGDAVNLAARLEGLTRYYHVGIIAGQATRDMISGHAWRELDLVRVKGKQQPVAIFEPYGDEFKLDNIPSSDITAFKNSWSSYLARDWAQAEAFLLEVSEGEQHSGFYGLCLKRIQHFKEAPPPDDWDGVYTHKTK